jgi:hypothetical protein
MQVWSSLDAFCSPAATQRSRLQALQLCQVAIFVYSDAHRLTHSHYFINELDMVQARLSPWTSAQQRLRHVHILSCHACQDWAKQFSHKWGTPCISVLKNMSLSSTAEAVGSKVLSCMDGLSTSCSRIVADPFECCERLPTPSHCNAHLASHTGVKHGSAAPWKGVERCFVGCDCCQANATSLSHVDICVASDLRVLQSSSGSPDAHIHSPFYRQTLVQSFTICATEWLQAYALQAFQLLPPVVWTKYDVAAWIESLGGMFQPIARLMAHDFLMDGSCLPGLSQRHLQELLQSTSYRRQACFLSQCMIANLTPRLKHADTAVGSCRTSSRCKTQNENILSAAAAAYVQAESEAAVCGDIAGCVELRWQAAAASHYEDVFCAVGAAMAQNDQCCEGCIAADTALQVLHGLGLPLVDARELVLRFCSGQSPAAGSSLTDCQHEIHEQEQDIGQLASQSLLPLLPAFVHACTDYIVCATPPLCDSLKDCLAVK